MSLKENSHIIAQQVASQTKRQGPTNTARKLDQILKDRVCMTMSQSKFPLGERTNVLGTPLPPHGASGEHKIFHRIEISQPSAAISHFDKASSFGNDEFKNDLILGIVPKDPHMTNLAEALERQAKEYQQKQLIQSFPLRYADLLSKEIQLNELQAKFDQLEQDHYVLNQNYQSLKISIAEREVQQIEKQNKIRLVLQESQAERQKLLESLRLECQVQIKEVKDALDYTKVQLQSVETKNKALLAELQELIGDRDRKEQEVQILAEAIKEERLKFQTYSQKANSQLEEVKNSFEKTIIELQTKLSSVTEYSQRLESNLVDVEKVNSNLQTQLTTVKKQFQELTFEKGITTEKLSRLEQQRVELRVQLDSLKLDFNQQVTIKSQKVEQIDSLQKLIAEQSEQIQNHSFVVAQLTGQITLKQVELGDKTADILTLKQKLDNLMEDKNKLTQALEKVSVQKTQAINGVAQNQDALRLKIQTQNETIMRLQDQIQFVKRQHKYLLTIREEMETEIDRLKKDYDRCSQQVQMSRVEKLSIEDRYKQLHKALEDAILNNKKEYQGLKQQVWRHIEIQQACKQQAQTVKNQANAKISLLEEECGRLKSSVDRHIKALAEKQFEHDKVVSKLIEVSNARAQIPEEFNELKKKLEGATSSIKEKDEQIKSLQALLRDTRATILSLSDSLKQRSARQKELFDEVLSEKKRMKRQIEQLQNELRSFKK